MVFTQRVGGRWTILACHIFRSFVSAPEELIFKSRLDLLYESTAEPNNLLPLPLISTYTYDPAAAESLSRQKKYKSLSRYGRLSASCEHNYKRGQSNPLPSPTNLSHPN